uniref:HSF1 n=1 Tax=Urechis unicinctus TaxID=6432 RepID=W8PKQ0_UREUN|nr:HSF1 [Urechis unicinctus]
MSENNAASGVPAFLTKLWTLVDDASTDEFIAWDSSGESFHVIDQTRFAKEILPLYFKHNNITSFIRQLNMYGFRKVVNIDSGALKTERDSMQFSHVYFRRNEEYLLENIKRKVGGNKVSTHVAEPKVGVDGVRAVLNEVNSIQDQQETMNTRMDSLKIENDALWREVAMLRQKHMKQQQVVNKLVQFLVTLVSSSQRTMPGIKRKKALMINDMPAKKSRQISLAAQSPPNGGAHLQEEAPRVTILEMTDPSSPPQLDLNAYQVGSTAEVSLNEEPCVEQPQDIIPVVDLNDIPLLQDEEIPTITVEGNEVVTEPVDNSLTVSVPSFLPTDTVITQDTDPLSTSLSLASTLTAPSSSTVSYRGDMEEYVDKLQTDLENLKGLLASNKYSLDANTLFGLFTPDAPLPATPDALLNAVKNDGASYLSDPLLAAGTCNQPNMQNSNIGTELIQYQPLDISSLLSDSDLLTDLDDEDLQASLPPQPTSDGLMTPKLEVTSNLARRRQSRKSESDIITMEDID